MKKLLTILFVCLLPFLPMAQTSNAGSDVTIYLIQTNSATLDGSASSATSYQWREISTDFSSGGTITSPTAKTTTVTGLTKQGTFYFELAATTGGVTKRDSMVLRVNYDVPPTGTLSNNFAMDESRISNTINWRGDTTSFFPDSDMTHSQTGDADTYSAATNWWILYRDRVNNMMIDSLRGKLTTTIQDGYGNGSMINGTQVKYPRTEIVVNKPSSIDTSHIYMYEWKGYYPAQTNYMTGNNAITTIFQIHADSSYGENTMDLSLRTDGTLTFTLFPNGPREQKYAIGTLSDWTNNSHTLRLTIREGYGAPNNPAFMKLEIDGKQVVVRDTGRIGGTPGGTFGDFAKFGTLYDPANAMVDANATGGTRKFSLITESLKRYALTSVAPLTNAGNNQIILLPATSATLNGSVTAVTAAIANYQWSKVSGGSATIANQNSLSTSVTGLSKGTYVFNLQATDVNGLQSNSTVQVIVQNDETIAATGYNYDVLVDGVLNGTVSSLRNHDIDGSGFSFYVNGFSSNSTALPSAYALPTDGVIVSPTNTRYQLQPYNSNNALWLDNTQSGTLTLTTPASFNKIKIALTSGGTSVQYKINYSDGTNDIVSHSINNWACQGCAFYAIDNLGRVDGTGALETTYWAIYEDSISPNPTKTVNSITFTSTGSWSSVFALTNIPNPIAPPTISISADQSITVSNTSVSAVGTAASGEAITSYAWSVVSGTATFSSSSSASPTVTELSNGVNKLRCTVTQTDGQTAFKDVTITVTLPAVHTYYISNAGNDSNDGLTTATSWQTVAKVNSSMSSFNPGDSILFKRGDTWSSSTITIGIAGVSGNNIILSAYGTGAQPILSSSANNPVITLTAAQGYWTIDNLDLRSSGNVTGINQPASIYFNYWGSDMGAVPGWVIQNCTFNSAIHVSGPNIEIRNNTFNGLGNSTSFGAICIRGSNGTGAIIEGNTISNYNDRGVWFYNGAGNVTVRNNIIHDIAIGADQHGAGINNDGANTPNPNAKLYGNTIYNCGYGISHESAFEDTTYNNIIHDCEVGMTSFFYPASYNVASNILIHHNLIHDVQYGFELWHTQGIKIVNNTVVNGNGASETAGFIQNADTTNVKNISFVNNIITGTWLYPVWNYLSDAIFTQFDYNDIVPTGTTVYRVNGVSNTLSQLQAKGLMTHGITSDPLLSSYNLTSGSPAINAGIDVGLPFTGTAPDMGAFETSGIAAPTANAGTNQTITLPTSTVNLTGSYTTASGHTATVLWTKVSGSGTQTITGNTTLTPSISGLSTYGTYVFQMKVHQDDDQEATSTVTITVNPAVTPQQPYILFPKPTIVIQLN